MAVCRLATRGRGRFIILPLPCSVFYPGQIPDPPGRGAVQPALGDPASAGVGLGDPQRSLPTPTILWFCVSAKGEQRHSQAAVLCSLLLCFEALCTPRRTSAVVLQEGGVTVF